MNRIVTIAAASVFAALFGGSALAFELPYTGIAGDPMGLTSTKSPAGFLDAAFETNAAAVHVVIPYTGIAGDPLGLVSGGIDLRFAREVVAPRHIQLPYTTSAGDPDDLI